MGILDRMDGICGLDIPDIASALSRGDSDSVHFCDALASRISEIDASGPRIGAIIQLNPSLREEAKARDAERAAGRVRGPLHGVPILLKDNIDAAGDMRTTAGSLALAGKGAARDAEIVRRLREAGTIILGKANMSEWANFRSHRSSSGWSALGGQTRNPHVLDRSPGGSSSGSAAAVAAFLAPAALGTETDGSIIGPASMCGVAGLKPTLGLVPRGGIVPIASSQDTAGPIARSCLSLSFILDAIAGSDPADPATLLPAISARYGKRFTLAAKGGNYCAGGYAVLLQDTKPDFIRGKRIGVARCFTGFDAPTDVLFEEAIDRLKSAGAVLVDPTELKSRRNLGKFEYRVLLREFKRDLEAYLDNRTDSPVRSLSSLILWNEANASQELAHFGQEIFEEALKESRRGQGRYRRALRLSLKIAQWNILSRAFRSRRIDFLAWPSNGPAGLIDHVLGDYCIGGETSLAAVSGWPSLTIPMGITRGALPAGLSLCSRPFSDGSLLALGHCAEALLGARKDPAFVPSLP
jgi:amidase